MISVEEFNDGAADLVVVLPLTTKEKGIPFHVMLSPPEGGVRAPSFVECEDVRSVSKERLSRRRGFVSQSTLEKIEDRLRILLGL